MPFWSLSNGDVEGCSRSLASMSEMSLSSVSTKLLMVDSICVRARQRPNVSLARHLSSNAARTRTSRMPSLYSTWKAGHVASKRSRACRPRQRLYAQSW